MKSIVTFLKHAAASGSCAGIVSGAALLLGGVRDCRSAIAPVNAVSHWLWKDKALRQDRTTLRYSATGYLIHHAASIFWASAHEILVDSKHSKRPYVQAVASAAAVTTAACIVDLYCTPQRLMPGFERRLSSRSLVGVYVAFGAGLLLHSVLSLRDKNK